jgi:hypothetical protein
LRSELERILGVEFMVTVMYSKYSGIGSSHQREHTILVF